MRKTIQEQMPLMQAPIEHSHAQELTEISYILDQHPECLEWVKVDLLRAETAEDLGRKGMTAEIALRARIVKQMNGYSYEELAFHLADSRTYRLFCRIGYFDQPPKRAALAENLARIRAETLENINKVLVQHGKDEKIEDGKKVRGDSTPVETNIHKPTDSSLLWDCVRVMTRLLGYLAQACAPTIEIAYCDHTKRAKRRYFGIHNAKNKQKRRPLYQDLLKVTEKTMGYAGRALELTHENHLRLSGLAWELEEELRHYFQLTEQVVDQTKRRVLQGESVPSSEKVVSIFEEHTDILVKGKRETDYGHKIFLMSGASSLITDCLIEEGNPADNTLAKRMIERQEALYGRSPRQVAFDGGFASSDNLGDLKELGVSDVAFHKKCGLEISEMVKSSWVYRKLKRFRAGVEGVISWLKRCFGLRRCLSKGFEGFKAEVWGAVVSANLLVLARARLARQ